MKCIISHVPECDVSFDDTTSAMAVTIAHLRTLNISASYLEANSFISCSGLSQYEIIQAVGSFYAIKFNIASNCMQALDRNFFLCVNGRHFVVAIARVKGFTWRFHFRTGWGLIPGDLLTRHRDEYRVLIPDHTTLSRCMASPRPKTYYVKDLPYPSVEATYIHGNYRPREGAVKLTTRFLSKADYYAEINRRKIINTDFRIIDAEGICDIESIKNYHNRVFHGVSWHSGNFRRVEISRGGMPYCSSFALSKTLSSWCSAVWCVINQTNGKIRNIDNIAMLLSDFNSIHPFNDGNGAVIERIASDLALHLGKKLTLYHLDKATRYRVFSRARRGNIELLISSLRDCLS